LEKIAILSSTLATTKDALQRRLGINAKPRAEVDLITGPQLRYLRSRSRPTPIADGIHIDRRFTRRFLRCGFHNLADSCPISSDLTKRVGTCPPHLAHFTATTVSVGTFVSGIKNAGAFYAGREVLPAMVEAGRGTILLTGASAALRGKARFSALAVGKSGLRALAQSMAREFGPQGIHVSHVIIDGQINTPSIREMSPDREEHTLLSSDSIAETY
jgi:NAD(P)-dependent dehydrogenase (short-subunit alcohol dehydrogenase family)